MSVVEHIDDFPTDIKPVVEKPFGYLCIPNRKAIDGCRIIFGGILFGFISSPEHDICNPAGPQHISLYLVFRSIGQYFIIQFRFFFKVFDFRVIIRIVEVDFQTIERDIIQVGFNAFYIDLRSPIRNWDRNRSIIMRSAVRSGSPKICLSPLLSTMLKEKTFCIM